MTASRVDDFTKRLIAEAERQRLEREDKAKSGELPPAAEADAALQELTELLAKNGATTRPDPSAGGGSLRDNNKKPQ